MVLDAKNEEIDTLKAEVDKLQRDKKNSTHMNELLLKKFNELSRQLLDKE
mgnify:CR=1 FL=1